MNLYKLGKSNFENNSRQNMLAHLQQNSEKAPNNHFWKFFKVYINKFVLTKVSDLSSSLLLLFKGFSYRFCYQIHKPTTSLQTHHVYSTLKRLGNKRFHDISIWNVGGVFVGFSWSRMKVSQKGIIIFAGHFMLI